jgi:hypothetical protein
MALDGLLGDSSLQFCGEDAKATLATDHIPGGKA